MSEMRTQLNIKIDHKTQWLASLAARYWGMTLAEFVESLIVKGVSREGMLSDEPRVQELTAPSNRVVPFHNALWSDDEATRLFNVATAAHDLLTEPQRKTWARITGRIAADGGVISLKSVRQHFEQIKESA